ncbi:hypothetical protein BJ138DRAFT_731600 [Hygrophoropsis aurantiaca]|uniref:Uncharacterized protein n=1 Tax=Hygrophoropsis aurantiaca TaxID=72124 RepID=A0ACB8AIN8_9AGAM|nr:hypothetical protein BJ138DRAFT_731600 [Hygrophoropsis aurantiaca]
MPCSLLHILLSTRSWLLFYHLCTWSRMVSVGLELSLPLIWAFEQFELDGRYLIYRIMVTTYACCNLHKSILVYPFHCQRQPSVPGRNDYSDPIFWHCFCVIQSHSSFYILSVLAYLLDWTVHYTFAELSSRLVMTSPERSLPR